MARTWTRTDQVLNAKIHMAQKTLSMSDTDYRDVLNRVTGKYSASLMTTEELQAVVAEMERLGYKPPGRARTADRPTGTQATAPVRGKIKALLLSLYHLGAVNSDEDAAREAFIVRQIEPDHANWLTVQEADKVIEALKAMLTRAGVVWDDHADEKNPAIRSRRCVIDAQWKRLLELGAIKYPHDVTPETFAYHKVGKSAFQFYDPADYDHLIRILGNMIRKAKAKLEQAGHAEAGQADSAPAS